MGAVVPTRRLLLLAGFGPVLSVAVLFVDLSLWFVGLGYICAIIFVAIYDARTGLARRHLKIDPEPPSVLHVGETGSLGLRIAATGRGASAFVEILCDADERVEKPAPANIQLDTEGNGELTVPLRPVRRGTAHIESIWCRWEGPFGLTLRTSRQKVDLEIPVLPNIPAVQRAALLLDRRGARAGDKPQLMAGAGSEFDALREYVAGLDRRSIDWKHSARHWKLISKEYKTEQNHNVVLAIDCGHVMREPIASIPKVDHAINAALIVAYQALREGDRIGVFGFDAEPRVISLPRSGDKAFARIQHTLAALDYSLSEPNFTFCMTRLMGELREPSIILVISDFLDSVSAELMVESLTHLAKRHLVLFAALSDPELAATADVEPDDYSGMVRSVVAEDLIRQRNAVLTRLRRAKVDAFDAFPRQLDVQLLTRFVAIKERATFIQT
ncbi:MAG: DUF58 domain-containing protein [Pseudomonadota bacterium]